MSIINAYGILGIPHSWATVMTALMLEIRRRGGEFRLISTNGAQNIHPSLRDNAILPTKVWNKGTPKTQYDYPESEFSLSYTIPPNLPRIKAKKKIEIYNYETNILPPKYAELINKHSTLFMPSSQFAADIFLNNGVDKEKTVVIPHGFYIEDFNPQIEPISIKGLDDDKFKFLTVAIAHWRKGYDVLIKAYIEEFQGDDSVSLIIKSGKDPSEVDNGRHVDFTQLFADLKTTHDYKWPEIRMVNDHLDKIARLYNYCDCLVLPTRTECFSLTPLEASACKKPVITTNYSGHLDFLSKETAYLIDYKLIPAPKEIQYHHFDPRAVCAEPDINHLRELMREVKNNYGQAQEKATLAYNNVVANFTWAKAVDKMLEELNNRGLNLLT